MTSVVEAPPRNLYDAGQWLVERHPDLAALCARIGAVLPDGLVDVGQVRESVSSFDAYVMDRAEFNRKNRLVDPSITLGPQPAPAAAQMLVMLPSQVAWLRLLATLAPGAPSVQWSADVLAVLGAGSATLLQDWLSAVWRFANP